MLDCGVPPFLASIGIPTAAQCLRAVGPVASVIFLWWLVRHGDHIIRRLFPTLEWQRQLGWLNIRAERRAAAVMRWISYAIYAALFFALCGILLSAYLLTQLSPVDKGPAPSPILPVLSILPILLPSIAIWSAYFAWGLFPRMRQEYEHEELERFRAETSPPPETEQPSRAPSPYLITKARISARSRR